MGRIHRIYRPPILLILPIHVNTFMLKGLKIIKHRVIPKSASI